MEKVSPRLSYRGISGAFAMMLPMFIKIAKEHGYALGVHGSMMTDLDLMAVPWIEKVSLPLELVEAMRSSIDGEILDKAAWGDNPSHRPHGRQSWIIRFKDCPSGPYIDLSIIATMPDEIASLREEKDRIQAWALKHAREIVD